MLKKLLLAAAALALSVPAFAGPHGKHVVRHVERGHRHVVVHKPVHVVHRPVHVYRPAPVVHHYYHRPAPRPVVVHHQSHPNAGALLVGAVLGAAIVHHVVTGY